MDQLNQTGPCGMRGFITERNFDEAEQEFPGITRYYRSCQEKPATFLDLVAAFLGIRRSARG